MAFANVAEHALADKTPSSSIPASDFVDRLPRHWKDLPGLIDEGLIDPDTQVRVLALVEETGSTSMGDIIAALPNHPAPAKAVMSLVHHGVLAIDPGLITSNSMLRRDIPAAFSRVDQPSLASGHDSPPPADKRINRMAAQRPQPELFIAHWSDRAVFRHEAALQRPGIYAALYADCVYIGMSADLAGRLVASNHLLNHGFPDLLVGIVDKNNVMTATQCRVAERQLARAVQKDGRLRLANRILPTGAEVSLADFSLADRFVRDAITAIGKADIGFFPQKSRLDTDDEVAEADPYDLGQDEAEAGELVEGDLLSLRSCGVHATARMIGGKVHVLGGSEIRRETVPSIQAGVVLRRQELLHDGSMVAHGAHFILTRDVAFDTASGAASFVTGSRLKPEIWRPLRQNMPSGLLH